MVGSTQGPASTPRSCPGCEIWPHVLVRALPAVVQPTHWAMGQSLLLWPCCRSSSKGGKTPDQSLWYWCLKHTDSVRICFVCTSGPVQPARSLHWVWGPGPAGSKGFLGPPWPRCLVYLGTSWGGITVVRAGSLTVGPPHSRLATQRFLRGRDEALLPCILRSSPRHRHIPCTRLAFLPRLPSP